MVVLKRRKPSGLTGRLVKTVHRRWMAAARVFALSTAGGRPPARVFGLSTADGWKPNFVFRRTLNSGYGL